MIFNLTTITYFPLTGNICSLPLQEPQVSHPIMASGSKSKISPPVKVLVAQSCPTLCDPMDCGPPGSSVRGILQARILEQVAILFSRGSSWPRDWTHISYVSCVGKGFLTTSAIWEALKVHIHGSNYKSWGLPKEIVALFIIAAMKVHIHNSYYK